MSFFGNTKVVGWMLFIIGILMVIAAFSDIYNGITMEGGLGDNLGYSIMGVGSLIAAVLYFLFGNSVRSGKTSGKINVLAGYVRIVGVTTVVINFFGAIGGLMSSISFWDSVLWIIIGLIVILVASKINDGKNTAFDKIIWIVLLIVFLILFLGNLLSIFSVSGIVEAIASICYAVMYLFILAFMFDKEVKDAML